MLAIDARMTGVALLLVPVITGFSVVFFLRVRAAFLKPCRDHCFRAPGCDAAARDAAGERELAFGGPQPRRHVHAPETASAARPWQAE